MRKIVIVFPVLVAVLSLLDRHFFKQNDSFCPKSIVPNWNRVPTAETSLAEIGPLLSQPFYYLTKGKQTFVFVSEDGKWVLKFPRLPRAKMLYTFCPNAKKAFFENTIIQAKAIDEAIRAETNITYSHLQPTTELKRVTLIDRFTHAHLVDLNQCLFFVQKKGEDFFEQFIALGHPKELITETIALFSSLYEKGFIDRDPILDKNFGIVDHRPFIIDAGQIEKVSELPPRTEYLQEMTQSLGNYLEKKQPKLYSFYQKHLH